MRIEPSGAVLAAVGLMASGQGYETTFAQCAAEGLGVRAADVAIRIGHSDIAPYGMGSRGARGASAGGGVLYLAGRRMREKVLRIAAHRLGLNAADGLDLVAGRVMRLVDGDWREAPLTLADIARTAHLDPLNLPPGTEPGLHVSAAYDPPPMTYSNATHACIVAIDEETGRLRIERYIVAHDSGTQINPTIVHGQLHGAIAMGLSGVLGEHCRYGDDGQMLAASLMDYPLAMARDLPMIEIVDVDHPSPHTPCGTKGMSEGGVMGAIGALCNAVSDALGVAVEAQPLTAENVRRLIVARR
jgi:carbon-monoxide dehydrogenase large subunit